MRLQYRDVRIIDLITHFFLALLGIVGVWILFGYLISILNNKYFFIILVVSIVLTYILLKYFLIGLVLMYKVCAPQSVRDRCRFEPTCSTYMIMAINKYGVIVGVIKGIKRLLRCKPPYGGIDLP